MHNYTIFKACPSCKAFLSAALFFWSFSVAAQSAESGQSICYEAQNVMNAIVDYTKTSCIPTVGNSGSLSFIVTSSESVFSAEASKKGWLLVAVATFGKILNDQPSLKADELWLSDIKSTKNRVTHVFPASLAKTLQHQVSNSEIDLEEMYAAINKNLVRKTIPNK